MINNISALQFFQLFRWGVLFLISIVITKAGYSNFEIGQWEEFNFYCGASTFFWISAIIQVFIPLYRQKYKESVSEKSKELFNAFILTLSCSFITIIVLFIFFLIDNKINISEIILFIFILIGTPSYLIEYIYLLQNRPKKILSYGISVFGLQFLLISSFLFLQFSIIFCISGLLLVSFIRFIWLWILLVKHADFKIDFHYLREHVLLAVPVAISLILSGAAEYIDGFLVKFKFDQAAFAVYRYGAKELPLTMLLANAMQTALIAEFYNKSFENGLQILKNKSKQLMMFLFPVTIVLLISSKYLYPIIFNQNFSESAKIFNLFLLIIISRLIFPQTIVLALKKTKIILLASFFELILHTFLSFLLINIIGILGVAVATCISYFFEKIILAFYLKSKENIPMQSYIHLKTWIIYSILTIIVFCCFF